MVQFVSSAASSHPHTTADETGTGRGMLGASARNKLLVRSVESLELEDGRTVLLCLVSSPELESEVGHLQPQSCPLARAGDKDGGYTFLDMLARERSS